MMPQTENDMVNIRLDGHDEQIHILNVAIFGDRDHVGINEDIRTIKRGTDLLVKLAWIVVSVFLGIVVSGATAAAVYLIRVMGK